MLIRAVEKLRRVNVIVNIIIIIIRLQLAINICVLMLIVGLLCMTQEADASLLFQSQNLFKSIITHRFHHI